VVGRWGVVKVTREHLIEQFLDDVADIFDNGQAVWSGSLFTDPRDGEPASAQSLLERIRLGKDAKEPNRE
jgi:hypothetical protein